MSVAWSGKWNYPTEIHFGAGSLEKVPELCAGLSITKPLIVTDEAMAELPVFKAWQASLTEQNFKAQVFSDVKHNPTGTNVENGKTVYLQAGCDGVIAFGGGSGIDAGKAIALLVGQDLDLFEFEDKGDNWSKVNVSTVAPCIAIPTTAGTGSEVGRASVIVDERDCVKKIIFHPSMLPKMVVADPELTFGLPAKLTAATGVDAFVHSLEAYCAPGFHPMADGIAVEGMRLIWQWLTVAYNEPQNLEARSQMLVASSMGATAFQKGLGAIHALAHPLGAVYDAHHGLLNAILMPYVLKANRGAIADRLEYLCQCLGSNHTGFDYFLQELLQWRKSLDIAHSLAEIGIDKQRSKEIAQMAFEDPSAGGNPIQFTVEEYEAILIAAIDGDL